MHGISGNKENYNIQYHMTRIAPISKIGDRTKRPGEFLYIDDDVDIDYGNGYSDVYYNYFDQFRKE